MGSLRTLGAIVDYMKGLEQPGAGRSAGALPLRLPRSPAAATLAAPVVPRRDAGTPAKAAPPLGRFVLERIAAPATGLAQPGLLGGGEVWVTGSAELDEPLAAELRARGVNARATVGPSRGGDGLRLPRRPAGRARTSTRRSP